MTLFVGSFGWSTSNSNFQMETFPLNAGCLLQLYNLDFLHPDRIQIATDEHARKLRRTNNRHARFSRRRGAAQPYGDGLRGRISL
jgi:hypothetical protein